MVVDHTAELRLAPFFADTTHSDKLFILSDKFLLAESSSSNKSFHSRLRPVLNTLQPPKQLYTTVPKISARWQHQAKVLASLTLQQVEALRPKCHMCISQSLALGGHSFIWTTFKPNSAQFCSAAVCHSARLLIASPNHK